MRDFKKMKVWEEAFQLGTEIYKLKYPPEERFGLQSQIKRSSSSIYANIMEGCGRDTKKELCRFLDIALGSANETEGHLCFSHEVGIIKNDDFMRLVDKARKIQSMLVNLILKIRPKDNITEEEIDL